MLKSKGDYLSDDAYAGLIAGSESDESSEELSDKDDGEGTRKKN